MWESMHTEPGHGEPEYERKEVHMSGPLRLLPGFGQEQVRMWPQRFASAVSWEPRLLSDKIRSEFCEQSSFTELVFNVLLLRPLTTLLRSSSRQPTKLIILRLISLKLNYVELLWRQPS